MSSVTKVVDLFCGIGGLTHGLQKKGLKVVAGYDLDDSCKYAYEKNNNATFFARDISEVSSKEILKHFEECDVKVLVGCAPCQPFSTYSFKTQDADKWRLLRQFSRLIKETKPDIVSMENVPRLAKFNKEPVFEEFTSNLKKDGYFVSYKIVNCPDYGIPQNRKRLVLLASKMGEINLIPPTHQPNEYVTVKDSIGKLEKIEHGQTSKKDPLHKASKLSELNLRRIKQSKPGGSWRDWDEDLKLECHKKETGNSYVSVYGRMKWNSPSPTITTQCIGIGNGRFGHPEQDRAITLREASILQTFPKNYAFFEKGAEFRVRTISTHIGNAVPVRLGEVIADSINQHISKHFK
jgi:DNA (cytosine-5)-methyltransferase 1